MAASSSSTTFSSAASLGSPRASVRLDVPYIQQTSPLNCGPTAVLMCLRFLGRSDVTLEQLEELVRQREGKAVSTVRLAVAAARAGHRVRFASTSLTFDEAHLADPYYAAHADISHEESRVVVEEARALGVELEERSVPQEELLSWVTPDSLVIVLLDYNVVRGRPGYCGHFVPVVGFDETQVFIHNQDLESGEAFVALDRDVFERARTAKGTDEDVCVIRRDRLTGAIPDDR